jgi:3-phenylpropionate/cinnamic acid dioxygenase small subunit
MLRLRVERLNGARTFSQKPKSRCHHVLQRPFVDVLEPLEGRFQTNTSMHYVETRLDEQILLALTVTHDLKIDDGKLKIAGKKVELLNSDAAFGNIQLLP